LKITGRRCRRSTAGIAGRAFAEPARAAPGLTYPPTFSDVRDAWTPAELCAAAALAIGLKSPSESLVCEVRALADL
jgi:hypothetical protein